MKFREVDDLLRLGRQLDNIFLENMKMFVNQPRFSRPTTYGKIRTIESDKKKNWAGISGLKEKHQELREN